MLTIKIKTIDSSRVYIDDVVEMSRLGERIFETIKQRAKENGGVCPGMVFEFNDVKEGDDGDTELNGYDIIINESGRNPAESELIGVLLHRDNDEYDDSLCYEFIYAGDSVYIMNEAGKTVEVLK